MTEQNKRLLIFILLILVVVGVLVMIWFLFFQPLFVKPPTTNENVNVNVNTGVLPNVNVVDPSTLNVNRAVNAGAGILPEIGEIANGDLTRTRQLTSTAVTEPRIGADGSTILYYDAATGQFMRLDPATGESVAIIQQKFPQVEEVTWSPDSTKAVLEFPDLSKIIYDFSSQQQTSLPSEADDFSFSADSTEIAYEFVGPGVDEQFLVVSSTEGDEQRAIAKIADQAPYIQVAWSPTDEVVGRLCKFRIQPTSSLKKIRYATICMCT